MKIIERVYRCMDRMIGNTSNGEYFVYLNDRC